MRQPKILTRLKEEIVDAIVARIAPRADDIVTKMAGIDRIELRLATIEQQLRGNQIAFIGSNRVLLRLLVGGQQLIFYLEADDKLITPWLVTSGEYETPLTSYFLKNITTKSHCIDVGANFGYFTCLMGRLASAGKVVGIEPDRSIFEIARDNIFINGLQSHTSMIHAAGTEGARNATLYRRHTRSGNTSFARPNDDLIVFHAERPATPFTVTGIRVDDLLPKFAGRIDFIKLDAEGAEPIIIRGAEAAIRSNKRITLAVEWSPGQVKTLGNDPGDMLAHLDALGLSSFDVDGSTPLPREALLGLDYHHAVIFRRDQV